MLRLAKIHRCWRGLLLALPALLCLLSPKALAQGTIVHFNPPDIGLFFGGTWDLDLNLDRQTDFFFRSTQGEFRVFPRGDNAVLSRRNNPPDISRYCTPLPFGVEISSLVSVGISWVPLEIIVGSEIGSTFSSCRDVGCIGDFVGRDAYLGVRFYIGEGLHYGWVRVSVPYVGINGGYIHEWAYETRPDTPILAGAKPVVVLQAPPEIVRPGYLRLRWQTEVGKAYQIQSKENLTTLLWTNLNFVIVATTTNAAADVPISGTTKFFRVVEAD